MHIKIKVIKKNIRNRRSEQRFGPAFANMQGEQTRPLIPPTGEQRGEAGQLTKRTF
jgi:hypothetical protein